MVNTMKWNIISISIVCLLLFGALAVEANESGKKAASDQQMPNALEALEQAYDNVYSIYVNQGSASEECLAHLQDARNELDDASDALGQGDNELAKQKLQDAMVSLRAAAQSLDAMPEQAGTRVAEQYKRILAAYGRLQLSSAALGNLIGDMPALQEQLSSIRTSIEAAEGHYAGGEYALMEQELQQAAQRIRATQEVATEAINQYKYAHRVAEYRSQLQEGFRKASLILANAQEQGLDTTVAEGLLEQYRAGVQQAMQVMGQGGMGQGGMKALKDALVELAPLGTELRAEIQELAKQMTE